MTLASRIRSLGLSSLSYKIGLIMLFLFSHSVVSDSL